ncbi:hypothetical protein TRFO_39449 [Tritrichomonas foetus]|uniref:Uncharacterized protein n=1 Tax=Tritrichomonas foetus TaxID=1144522 RepID=A0A1J4J816_9EUKA|nr:hypothetical protein TRFO_39449 [Tritrichomonas foetus]|eukprot:OHS94383.1 hypothetical protein TRFO_39449 [Tritrichomonas foetus]
MKSSLLHDFNLIFIMGRLPSNKVYNMWCPRLTRKKLSGSTSKKRETKAHREHHNITLFCFISLSFSIFFSGEPLIYILRRVYHDNFLLEIYSSFFATIYYHICYLYTSVYCTSVCFHVFNDELNNKLFIRLIFFLNTAIYYSIKQSFHFFPHIFFICLF